MIENAKKEKRILNEKYYRNLKKDFLIIHIIVILVITVILAQVLLQRFDLIPSFPCMFHEILHMYCPGCGGTRAFFAMMEGDFLKSLYYNPAVVMGVLLFLYYEIGVLITLIKKNGKAYLYRKKIFLYFYLIINFLFFILRNYLLLFCGYDMLNDFIN